MRTKKQIDILQGVDTMYPGMTSSVTNAGPVGSFLPNIVTTKAKQMAAGNNLKSFYAKSGFIDKTSHSIEQLHNKAIAEYMQNLPQDDRNRFLPPVKVKYKKWQEPKREKERTFSEDQGQGSPKIERSKPKYFTEGLSSLSRKPRGSLVVNEKQIKPQNLPATLSMTREDGQIIISISLQEKEKSDTKTKQSKKKSKKKQKTPSVSSVQIGFDAELASKDKFYIPVPEKSKLSKKKRANKIEPTEEASPTTVEQTQPQDSEQNDTDTPLDILNSSLSSLRKIKSRLPTLESSMNLSTISLNSKLHSESGSSTTGPKIHEIKIGDGILINHFVFGMRHGMIYAKRFEKRNDKNVRKLKPIVNANAELGIRKYPKKTGTSLSRAIGSERVGSLKQASSLTNDETKFGYPHIIDVKPRPMKKVSHGTIHEKDTHISPNAERDDNQFGQVHVTSANELDAPSKKPPTIPDNMRKAEKPDDPGTKTIPRTMRPPMGPSPSPPTAPPNTAEQATRMVDNANNANSNRRSDFTPVSEESPRLRRNTITPGIVMTPAPLSEDLDSDAEPELNRTNSSCLEIPNIMDSVTEMRPPVEESNDKAC